MNDLVKENNLDILKQFFESEVQYFYGHYAKYNPERKIDVTIADSIFETANKFAIPNIQKEALEIQGKTVTDALNGTVILCNDIKKDGVQIIISKQAVLRDDGGLTLVGTINHEFTHANDFMDFADYLGTTDSESIMSNNYWYTMQMWSEFHARRNGFLRVLNAATGGTLEYPEDYMEHELRLIKSNWRDNRDANELYELMQLCGRYSVLEELYPQKLKGFVEDMLSGEYSGSKVLVCDRLYQFCKEHTDFERFINNIDVFKSLIS